MADFKSLAKDSVIYGLSSIAGRFINYLLVPLQTAKFAASGGESLKYPPPRRRHGEGFPH